MNDEDKVKLNDQRCPKQKPPVFEHPACDIDKYREHIENFDISEEERIELIKTIWFIMATFVDLGFGVDSIQLLPSSEQQQKLPDAQVRDGLDGQPVNSKEVTHDDEQ